MMSWLHSVDQKVSKNASSISSEMLLCLPCTEGVLNLGDLETRCPFIISYYFDSCRLFQIRASVILVPVSKEGFVVEANVFN